MKTNKYSIHESKTGNVIVKSIELDSTEIETVSSDSAEGHFRANRIKELANLGTQSVYAIIQ